MKRETAGSAAPAELLSRTAEPEKQRQQPPGGDRTPRPGSAGAGALTSRRVQSAQRDQSNRFRDEKVFSLITIVIAITALMSFLPLPSKGIVRKTGSRVLRHIGRVFHRLCRDGPGGWPAPAPDAAPAPPGCVTRPHHHPATHSCSSHRTLA